MKKYIKPQSKVYKVKVESPILTGSNPDPQLNNNYIPSNQDL